MEKRSLSQINIEINMNKYQNKKFTGYDTIRSELSKRFHFYLIFTPIVTRINRGNVKRQKLINWTVIPQGIKKKKEKKKRHQKRPRRNKRHIIKKRTIQLKTLYCNIATPLGKTEKKKKHFLFHLQNTRTYVRKIHYVKERRRNKKNKRRRKKRRRRKIKRKEMKHKTSIFNQRERKVRRRPRHSLENIHVYLKTKERKQFPTQKHTGSLSLTVAREERQLLEEVKKERKKKKEESDHDGDHDETKIVV